MAASSPGFPRYEDIDLADANYREEIRWRLFIDSDDDPPVKAVLVSMGEFWTVLEAPEFRRLAERILRQL